MRPADGQKALAPFHLTHQRIFAWIDQAASGLAGRDRFAVLPLAAKAAFRAGEMDVAQSFARELLQMAPNYTKERDYGDAIYDGYSVMGRVALRRENLPLARQYLMNAATTPGSPAINPERSEYDAGEGDDREGAGFRRIAVSDSLPRVLEDRWGPAQRLERCHPRARDARFRR